MNKLIFFLKPLYHYKHCSLFLFFCWEHQLFFLYKFVHGWFWRIIFFSLFLHVLKHNLRRPREAAGGPPWTSWNTTRLSADASSMLPVTKNKQTKRKTNQEMTETDGLIVQRVACLNVPAKSTDADAQKPHTQTQQSWKIPQTKNNWRIKRPTHTIHTESIHRMENTW